MKQKNQATVAAAQREQGPSAAPRREAAQAAACRHADEATLARRLRQLARLFELPAVQGERLAAADVVAYYTQSHAAYRKYHSEQGAVHMALNDGGRFDAAGYLGQVQRLLRQWEEAPTAQAEGPRLGVLEIGFGQGFNLEWLAQQRPHWRLEGLDLTPTHFDIARQRLASHAQVKLHLGDMHDSGLPAAGFDHIYAVEVMCHATDLPRAMAEMARLLKPGGTLTLFDGYVMQADLQGQAALAAELVARGMAIEALQSPAQMQAAAAGAGLLAVDAVVLDEQVMPTLRRLESMTAPMLWWPWLTRRALRKRALWRGRNLMAGSLMRPAVALGYLGYWQWVWRKPA